MIFALLLYSLFYLSFQVQPTWTNYSPNIMYSGQFILFLTNTNSGTYNKLNQPIYRGDVSPSLYFTSAPRIVLSLLGYKQNAPSNSNTSVGFDPRVTDISATYFNTTYNIYGASMAYLTYMYLALSSTNTDYYFGQYLQTFNVAALNKTYQFDVLYNTGQQYLNYPTNIIQMKGFLSGYKIKQGTATGFYLNFSMSVKNGQYFTIIVSTDSNSVIEQIKYYRIGYDRTKVEKNTNNDVFRDFYFELINNTNVADIYAAGWASQTQFQYRNFLMGTNKINIAGTIPMAVQFFLYYYFAQSLSKVDNTTSPTPLLYIDNPAIAKYLFGNVFYHVIKNCSTNLLGAKYYLPTDRKCYASCPTVGFYPDDPSGTCLPCHYSCKTCNQANSKINCLSCDINQRYFVSSNHTCSCPLKKFDDGINLVCKNCHSKCLTCKDDLETNCMSCNTSQSRQFYDSDNDGIGICKCILGNFQNGSGLCTNCNVGCLVCSNVLTCSSCNTTANYILDNSNNKCKCASEYTFISNSCVREKCGDGIQTVSQQCDDNNLVNQDGCSSSCKVEANHICLHNVSISPYSICYFNGNIAMQITQVTKSPYENKVSLTIKIGVDSVNTKFLNSYLTDSPSIVLQDISRRLFQRENFQFKEQIKKNVQIQNHKINIEINKINRMLVRTTLTITSMSFDLSTMILSLQFSYDQSFDLTTKKIKFIPSVSISSDSNRYFYNSPQAVINLQSTYNKIDTNFHSQSQYNDVLSFKYAFLVLIIFFWISSLLLIFIRKGNIAMESMILLQIAYFSLLSQEKLTLMFGGLSQLGKYTAGYNILFIKGYSQCVNFLAINLSCSLVNNLNISFIIMAFFTALYYFLKLINYFLNLKAQKLFTLKLQRKNVDKDNERTNENINVNFQNQQERNSELSHSQSSQVLQQNYYKEKHFISDQIFNIILDLIFFMAFVTVAIWGLSICFIKQQTIPNIILASIMGLWYALLWTFWFFKYFSSSFSFVQAIKRKQTLYQQQSQSSQKQENQIKKQVEQNEQNRKNKQQNIPKSGLLQKFSGGFLKMLYYPLLWASLLGISIILAQTQAYGYATQSIIIAGSILFAIVIWFSNLYKEKINIFRALLNCLSLCFIEVVYIISQTSIAFNGSLPLAIVVFILLSIILLSNSIITLYLYLIQRQLKKKEQESKEVEKIDQQIMRLQQLKKQKQKENMHIFFKFDKSSQNSSNPNKFGNDKSTVKKQVDARHKISRNSYDQTETKLKKTERDLPNVNIVAQKLDFQKGSKSQPYVPINMYGTSNSNDNQKVQMKKYHQRVGDQVLQYNYESLGEFITLKKDHHDLRLKDHIEQNVNSITLKSEKIPIQRQKQHVYKSINRKETLTIPPTLIRQSDIVLEVEDKRFN